ncbi:MAG: ATP-binding protein [Luteimonas sp.]
MTPLPWLRMGVLLIGSLLLLLTLNQLMDAGAHPHSPQVQRIDTAEVLASDGTRSSPMAIRLPTNCHANVDCSGRYRIALQHDAAAGTRYALYIPQFTGRLKVRLNGVPVLDSIRDATTSPLGQSDPQLVLMPERVLQRGDNELELKLTGKMGVAAVGPVYFGPAPDLRPSFEIANFMVFMLPRLMDGSLLAIGAIMLMIWFTRRHDQLYLLCAMISLSYALSSLAPVIAETFSDKLLLPISVLRFVSACLLLPFVWRLVGRPPPVRTRWFLLPPALMFGIFLALPDERVTMLVPTLFVPIALALALVAMRELWRAGTRGKDPAALTMLAAIAVAMTLTARDQLVMAGVLDRGYVMLARFNGPILAGMMGAILLRRFAGGLALLENFNARLSNDIATARDKLQKVFERERVHARAATLAAERVRLMGDLHDGIAGQLMSIIALSERSSDAAAREVTQACHRALTDLRLVVDSMDDMGDDLGMMLAAFRDRIEPQLRRSRVRLDWQVRGLPDLPGLSPATTLAIFRILQEAVNNAVRHSGANIVEVASSGSPLPGHGVRVSVRDLGCGGAVTRRGHYGMDNMQRRAAALGATLTVESGDGGTCVTLDLPLIVKA